MMASATVRIVRSSRAASIASTSLRKQRSSRRWSGRQVTIDTCSDAGSSGPSCGGGNSHTRVVSVTASVGAVAPVAVITVSVSGEAAGSGIKEKGDGGGRRVGPQWTPPLG